jgi:hypothetical protein
MGLTERRDGSELTHDCGSGFITLRDENVGPQNANFARNVSGTVLEAEAPA